MDSHTATALDICPHEDDKFMMFIMVGVQTEQIIISHHQLEQLHRTTTKRLSLAAIKKSNSDHWRSLRG